MSISKKLLNRMRRILEKKELEYSHEEKKGPPEEHEFGTKLLQDIFSGNLAGQGRLDAIEKAKQELKKKSFSMRAPEKEAANKIIRYLNSLEDIDPDDEFKFTDEALAATKDLEAGEKKKPAQKPDKKKALAKKAETKDGMYNYYPNGINKKSDGYDYELTKSGNWFAYTSKGKKIDLKKYPSSMKKLEDGFYDDKTQKAASPKLKENRVVVTKGQIRRAIKSWAN